MLIIADMEQRRNGTLRLLETYKYWKTDKLLHRKKEERPTVAQANERWQQMSDEIKTLWPTSDSRWPHRAS